MQRTLLLAKIHNCTLTDANWNDGGRIGIDKKLMEAAGILPCEQVQAVNKSNGERSIACAIELNDAAARLGAKGDRLILMTYGQFPPEEVKVYSPTAVLVNDRNRLLEVCRYNEVHTPTLAQF